MKKTIFNHVGRRQFLKGSVALGALTATLDPAVAFPAISQGNDREYWVEVLTRISGPVLKALSERKLKAEMPVEAPHGNTAERRQFTYLGAMGHLLTGIAPWLESGPLSGPEGGLRTQYAEWSLMAIAAATDPASPDFMNFKQGSQPIVDTAFLALAILRAPTQSCGRSWTRRHSRTSSRLFSLRGSFSLPTATGSCFWPSWKRPCPSRVCGGIRCASTMRSAP